MVLLTQHFVGSIDALRKYDTVKCDFQCQIDNFRLQDPYKKETMAINVKDKKT